jgi:hypothetical protein
MPRFRPFFRYTPYDALPALCGVGIVALLGVAYRRQHRREQEQDDRRSGSRAEIVDSARHKPSDCGEARQSRQEKNVAESYAVACSYVALSWQSPVSGPNCPDVQRVRGLGTGRATLALSQRGASSCPSDWSRGAHVRHVGSAGDESHAVIRT